MEKYFQAQIQELKVDAETPSLFYIFQESHHTNSDVHLKLLRIDKNNLNNLQKLTFVSMQGNIPIFRNSV